MIEVNPILQGRSPQATLTQVYDLLVTQDAADEVSDASLEVLSRYLNNAARKVDQEIARRSA